MKDISYFNNILVILNKNEQRIAKKNNISEIATYRGRLEKSIAQMTHDERVEHYRVAAIRTRKFLFQSDNYLFIKKMVILWLNMPMEK